MRDILHQIPPGSRIGMHAANDDARHFTFLRDSKIPHGTFGQRRIDLEWKIAGWIIVLASIVIIGWALIIGGPQQ